MIEPFDVACPAYECWATPGEPCTCATTNRPGRTHRARQIAADQAEQARACADGAPVPVTAMPHPHAALWIARFECPSCGQRHWAVWRDGEGECVAHRPRCRIRRSLRPRAIHLRPTYSLHTTKQERTHYAENRLNQAM